MRTFIIRARKGTTRWERVRSQIGSKEHFEVIAHSLINAFYFSNNFRTDVEVYLTLDSSEHFPHTLRLVAEEGLSLEGFHEEAVLKLIEKALKNSRGLQKDQTKQVEEGVWVSGFGFEKLISKLIPIRPLYLLEPKGEDLRTATLKKDPVFILSDHLAMPKKTISGLKRQGLQSLSLGKKMLFASQCIVLLNHEIDRSESCS